MPQANNWLGHETYLRRMAAVSAAVILALGLGIYSGWDIQTFPPDSSTFGGIIIGLALLAIIFANTKSRIGRLVCLLAINFLAGAGGRPIIEICAPTNREVIRGVITIAGETSLAVAVIGAAIPNILEGWEPFLLMALFTLGFGALGQPAIPEMPAIAWAGVILLTQYVAWNWSVSTTRSHTIQNVFEGADGIVLGSINFFRSLV